MPRGVYVRSAQTRAVLSAAHKGKPLSPTHRANLARAMGSPAVRKKLSESHTGPTHGLSRSDAPERFWSLVDKSGECWIWQGTKTKAGYGQFTVEYKRRRFAHRYCYTLYYGRIPKGLLICHTCDNPSCVNPDHLFAGTAKDNAQDAARKGRAGRKPRVRG